MTAGYFHHNCAVLDRHCEAAGRDPAEIRRTVLMPTLVSDDPSAVSAFVDGRRLGEGTAAGSKSFVIDRIGEIRAAGAEEIMIGGLATAEPEMFQQVDEEILSAFQLE